MFLIAGFLLGIYFLFDLLYSRGRSAGIPIFVWILLLWGGPIAVDLIRYGLGDMGESELFAGFSTCSPVGALIVLWSQSVVDTTPGIVIQALTVALPGVMWLTARLRQARSASILSATG